MKNFNMNKIVKISMLTAVATILFFIKIPMPFIAPPFYELDLSGLAALIGGFAMGPLAGVIIEFLKNLINLLIDGSITGGVGELSNVLTGCAFVLPASIMYSSYKSKKSALIGIIAGIVVMTVFGYFSNVYVMIPTYSKALKIPLEALVGMGTKIHKSVDSVSSMVLLCVVPFNLIKGIVVGSVTFLLYKKVRRML